MSSTITKFIFAVIIGLSVLLGFLAFTGSVINNYDVQNTTSSLGELQDSSNKLLENISLETYPTSKNVEQVKEITFVGTIAGIILNAVTFPFRILAFAFTFISKSLALLGLPKIISDLITLTLTLLIMFGVLKIILGREKL